MAYEITLLFTYECVEGDYFRSYGIFIPDEGPITRGMIDREAAEVGSFLLSREGSPPTGGTPTGCDVSWEIQSVTEV